eukprot:3104280-Amphidinium_carterae.1
MIKPSYNCPSCGTQSSGYDCHSAELYRRCTSKQCRKRWSTFEDHPLFVLGRNHNDIATQSQVIFNFCAKVPQ